MRESLGTVTHNTAGLKSHNFAQFRIDPPGKKRASDEEWVALTVERALGPSRETAKFSKKLNKKLSAANLKDSSLGSRT
jgi:hypothetical protein